MKNGFKDFCDSLELKYEYSHLQETLGQKTILEICNESVDAENCDQK